jgi:hypothetical protein
MLYTIMYRSCGTGSREATLREKNLPFSAPGFSHLVTIFLSTYPTIHAQIIVDDRCMSFERVSRGSTRGLSQTAG